MFNTSSLFAVLLLVASCSKNNTSSNDTNVQAYGDSSYVADGKKVNSLDEKTFVPDRVFFDFDSNHLTKQSREAIKTQYEYFRDSNIQSVTIEGHTDIRGTSEYNISLGLRRADAVKKELKKLGYKGKIKTVTFGKKRVAVSGNTAEAHAQNRRGVITLKSN